MHSMYIYIYVSYFVGTASLDPRSNGKISITAFAFVFVINMTGALLGVAVFFVFNPGLNIILIL